MQHWRALDEQDFEPRIRRLEELLANLEGLIPGGIFHQVSARQWQSALALQGKLNAVRDVIPADYTDPVTVQWFAAGMVREPPRADPVWTFTKTTLGYSDAQMLTLNALAHQQDS